jgi:hypothetical protein
MQHSVSFARVAAFLLTLAMMLGSLPIAPAVAAEPGAEIVRFSGALSADVPARTVPLAGGGPANLRLAVSGGGVTDTITLAVLNAGNTVVNSWVARSGETIWAYADLPSGAKLRVQSSGAALTFDLKAYARGTLANPTSDTQTWSGTAIGAGANSTNSTVQLVAPAPGLYRFTLGAAQGSYQIVVDANRVRKTVVSGKAPAPTDSVYFLPAGVHTFTIVQNPTAGTTAWSVQFAAAGAADTLPYAENAAELGGAFTEEWTPIQVAQAQPVNIRIAATGAAADRLQVELFNGSTKVFTSTTVAGGEIVWGSTQLAAGANALRVVTIGGNSAPLAYNVTISALAEPEITWSGASYGASPANSSLRVRFAESGLYRFTLGASAGRYQLRLNTNDMQKIVTTAGADLTAFVPAGTHTLTVDHDSQLNTTWSVKIAPTSAANDTLPFRRSGATLGGAGNDFAQEWLPIRSDTNRRVNIKVTALDGAANDALQVQLFRSGQENAAFTAAKVLRGEVFWATTDLVSGTNLLRIAALNTNTAAMQYQVEISSVGAIPATWSGIAHGDGLSSTLTVNAPRDGIYTVVLTLTVGAGQLLIESPTPAPSAAQALPMAGSNLTLRVPLTAGPHRFVFRQDAAQPRTEWQVDARLAREATPLAVSQVRPGMIPRNTATLLEVIGTGFESGSTVTLIDSAGKTTTLQAAAVSDTRLTITVPANLADGAYGLRVNNPGGASVTRSAALNVGMSRIFLPMLNR